MANILQDAKVLAKELTRKSSGRMAFSADKREEANEKLREMFREIIGTDKIDRKVMRKYKADIFSIIEETIDQTIVDGALAKDAFHAMFVESKYLPLGDQNAFVIPQKSELQVARLSEGNWTLRRQRIDKGQTIAIETETFGIKFFDEFVRFMNGSADFANSVGLAIESLNKYISALSYEAFRKALKNVPACFQHSGAYDEAKVMDVIASVEGASGQKAILVGTKRALAKLQGKVALPISSDIANEINRQGYLSLWNGCTCVELPQGFELGKFMNEDGTPAFVFDDNEVYVLAGNDKMVKFVYEGAEMVDTKDVENNVDQTSEYTLLVTAGCSIIYSKIAGLINITE